MTKADLESVILHWYAVPNENRLRGGWMPVYDHDGKMRGDTYGGGHDLETALALAREAAEEQASRYIGDWRVVVAKKPGFKVPKQEGARTPRAPATARRAPEERDDLPWRQSYANWTIRVGEAAARYGATIAYGADTYDAWKAGVSPDAYARSRARTRR